LRLRLVIGRRSRLVICRGRLVICRGRRVVGRRCRSRSITRIRLHYSKTVVVVNQLGRDRGFDIIILDRETGGVLNCLFFGLTLLEPQWTLFL